MEREAPAEQGQTGSGCVAERKYRPVSLWWYVMLLALAWRWLNRCSPAATWARSGRKYEQARASSIPISRGCSKGCGWVRGCAARPSLPARRSSSPLRLVLVLNHFAFPAHGVSWSATGAARRAWLRRRRLALRCR